MRISKIDFSVSDTSNEKPVVERIVGCEPSGSSVKSSSKASQRRLGTETFHNPHVNAVPTKLVEIIIKYGNNPDGLPPLLYATKKGDLEAVKLLIQHGADPFTREGKDGRTALYFAVLSKSPQMVEFFLNQKLDPNDLIIGGHAIPWEFLDVTSFVLLVKHGLKLDSASYTQLNAPTLSCIGCGRLDLLILILSNGGDLPRENLIDGIDPVLWSVAYNCPGRGKEKIECLNWLIQAGILKLKNLDISTLPNPTNANFIGNSFPEMLEFLVNNNLFKINQKFNGRDDYPLHLIHRPELVQFLIEKGADVNVKTSGGVTPLHYAATVNYADKDYLRYFKILLDNGADVNIRDVTGQTPLKQAQDPNIKKLLMRYGAEE